MTNYSALAALGLVALAGCTQDAMRYDAPVGGPAPVYRPATAAEQDFAAGFAAIRSGNIAAAEIPLSRHLSRSPTDPYALLAMGVVMENAGQRADAVTYYRSAALYGKTSPLGETVSLDETAASDPKTIRDLALLNIARLE